MAADTDVGSFQECADFCAANADYVAILFTEGDYCECYTSMEWSKGMRIYDLFTPFVYVIGAPDDPPLPTQTCAGR